MVSRRRLRTKNQTGREMHRIINAYSSDLDGIQVFRRGMLVPVSRLTIKEAFEFVRDIPYRRDTKPIEVVARPRNIIANRKLGMDCKKKAILLSSFLRQRRLPYRLVASSRLPNRRIHHVFPQLGVAGEWLNFDATYPHYRPFAGKQLTRMEVLNAG